MHVESASPSPIIFKPWLVQHSVVFLQPERQCSNCQEWWPLDSEFWYVTDRDKQGFTKQCKACLQEKQSTKRARSPGRPPKPVNTVEKPCTVCKIVKKLNTGNFKPHSGHSDGFQSMCKICVNAKSRARTAIKRKEREQAKLVLKASMPKPAPKPRKRKSRATVPLLLSA